MSVQPFIRQLAIVAGTMFVSLSTGAGMGYPSMLIYQLSKPGTEIALDLDTTSWIGSIHGLAGILGIIAPVIMQWKGRKFTFIAGCIVTIAAWTTGYAANGIAMILVSESLHGFGANVLLPVSYDCLSEMITPIYRNVALQLYGVFYVLGVAMPGTFTSYVHWRVFCIIFCVPVIIAIVISCFWLESPLWLAFKGNLDKCKTNFTKLRGTDEFSVKELREVMAANQEKLIKKKTSEKDSVLKSYWHQIARRDFIIPALHILLLFSHTYWSGTCVILLYSMGLISKSTENESAAVIGGIVINFSYVFGATISTSFIRFYNNKSALLLSTCAATVFLLSVSIVSYLQSTGMLNEKSLLILYLLVGYMISTSLGQTSVVFTVTAELMPVKHRGIGGALFVVAACSMNASSMKISPYLFVYIGLWGTFLLYTLNSIICGLLIWKYVPETKGRTLPEIENFYTHGTFEIKLPSDETEVINIKDA